MKHASSGNGLATIGRFVSSLNVWIVAISLTNLVVFNLLFAHFIFGDRDFVNK